MSPAPRAPVGAHNPWVREARRLERDVAERRRRSLYIAWGMRLAEEAVAARAPCVRVFAAPEARDGAAGRALVARLREGGATVLSATRRVLDSIAEGAGDQGVLLVLRRPETALATVLARRPTLILLAQGVQDPGNLGSMARTALALGADAFLALEGCADPFSSRAARGAMGALFRLPVAAGESRTVLPALAGAGMRIVAADVAAHTAPDAVDLRPATVLCVGSEGRGLDAGLLAAAHERVRIPMTAGASSLNVHAAAAALLYEAQRQRRDACPR